MDDMWLQEDLREAVKVLEKGGVLLYPTDTIWGLGCDALNERAIAKVYKIKERDPQKPCIVLMSDIDMLKEYVISIHPRVETLLSLHERPLTIVYPEVEKIPDALRGPQGKVAIRVARDGFCRALIKAFGKPIVSTSANHAGKPHPNGFGEISSQIIKKADYVVKFRQSEHNTGLPSVVATYNFKGHLEFLRS
ncbi:MAG: L-threonylcarbamoyladenylate synthase [Saprospiraceae bacterium]|nr:L-threonylcarbamoyladenylate synthase [Saprospiraceae bacterium]